MSPVGCIHLESYKEVFNKKTYKWIHAVFVVSSSSNCHRVKLAHKRCDVCNQRGPFLHACLECVFFGCHTHIRKHATEKNHSMSIDLIYGQTHCSQCNDYVYDSEIEAIASENRMKCKSFKKRLFEINTWSPDNEEREFLRSKTRKICISPESTIGLRGLINLGQTCFMNSVVQVLMHTPILRDYFLTEEHKCQIYSPGTCLVCEVSKLFQEFYSGIRSPLVLHNLLHLVWTKAKHLAGYLQQDAHEFFIAALELLHQHCLRTMANYEANISKNSKCLCIVDQIFSGSLQSSLVCQKCEGVSTTYDPIWDFSLDLGPITVDGIPPQSLIDCLECFTKAEHLGNDAAIYCSNCKSNQLTTKQLTFKTLPIIISFHLKRFHVKYEMLNTKVIEKKISTSISFPEMLDMTPFMSCPRNESPFPSDNRYSLFAVISHIGKSTISGHYIAYVRQLQDYWYKCADQEISKASLDEVLASEGYLLFYHKHVLEYD